MTEAPVRSYKTLWLLLTVALLPLALAVVMYFGGVAIPEGRTHHGALVLDQPPLTNWPLQAADGDAWQSGGKWQLLQVADECGPDCQRWRRELPQLHQALGRERGRVAPQRIATAPATVESMAAWRWVGAGALPRAGIWVADPLGNLVLYYRFDQPPRELLQDLKRLLKVSKVG